MQDQTMLDAPAIIATAIIAPAITAPTTTPVVEAAPVHNRDIMRANDYTIILMPSGSKKIVKLTPGTKVQLGKFGSCLSDDLIGHLFDIEYDIDRDGVTRTRKHTQASEEKQMPSVSARNNQFISDTRDAQTLNEQQILDLKAASLAGEISAADLVKQLVQNSTTFAQKTDFAQAKYIKKKEKKFLKSFTPQRPTATNLSSYLLTENAQKIMEMRVDTLSQFMTLGNVHANARYLVCDETHGLVLGAVMERMAGHGEVLVVHEKEKERFGVAEWMNFGQEWDIVKYLHYSRLAPHPDEDIKVDELPQVGKWEERNEKIQTAVAKVVYARSIYDVGGFDGLFLAITANPLTLINLLAPKLAASRPLVLYSPHKEHLLPAYHLLRHSVDWVNVTLTESWMREYQVGAGVGTHPLMTMSAGGGFLLCAIKVVGGVAVEGKIARGGNANKKQKY